MLREGSTGLSSATISVRSGRTTATLPRTFDVTLVLYVVTTRVPSGIASRLRTRSPPLAIGTFSPREWARAVVSMPTSKVTDAKPVASTMTEPAPPTLCTPEGEVRMVVPSAWRATMVPSAYSATVVPLHVRTRVEVSGSSSATAAPSPDTPSSGSYVTPAAAAAVRAWYRSTSAWEWGKAGGRGGGRGEGGGGNGEMML